MSNPSIHWFDTTEPCCECGVYTDNPSHFCDDCWIEYVKFYEDANCKERFSLGIDPAQKGTECTHVTITTNTTTYKKIKKWLKGQGYE